MKQSRPTSRGLLGRIIDLIAELGAKYPRVVIRHQEGRSELRLEVQLGGEVFAVRLWVERRGKEGATGPPPQSRRTG